LDPSYFYLGTARYSAVGFQAGGKAYFGTGYGGNYFKKKKKKKILSIQPNSEYLDLSKYGFSGNKDEELAHL
jgi:hypothetical protein